MARTALFLAGICFIVASILHSSPVDKFPAKNWSLEHRFEPDFYREASSVDEIRAVFQEALHSTPPRKVKIVGSGHSWNDVAVPSGGVMLSIRQMNQLVALDTQTKQITVEAGMLVVELNEILAKHNLSLTVQASVNAQQVGGLLATCSHGTGVRYKAIPDLVVSMKLLSAAGELLELSHTRHPDTFNAALVSLGSLGVITEVTFQCVDMFNLREEEQPISTAEILANFDAIGASADHVKLWWVPHGGIGQVFRFTRTTEQADAPKWLNKWYLEASSAVMVAFAQLSSVFPVLTNTFMSLSFLHFKPNQRIARNDQVFNIPFTVPIHDEMEFAVPKEHCAAVFAALVSMIDEREIAANHIVEVRWVAADDIWLSPNYHNDACHIELLFFHGPGNQHIKQLYYDEFEKMALAVGARPHWAKTFSERTVAQFPVLYPHWGDYLRIQHELDPHRLMQNDFLKRVFGA